MTAQKQAAGPGVTPIAAHPERRIYRRSLGTRILAVCSAALFVGGALSYLALSAPGPGLVIIGFLTLLSLVNLVTAWGDRFTIDGEGVEHRNLLLARLGVPARRIAWDVVEQVREYRRPSAGRPPGSPRALFMVPRSGRRIVLDSLERYDEIVDAIRSRVPPVQ